MTNLAPSNKDTFIEILKEYQLPCHNCEVIWNSVGDDLNESQFDWDELEASEELAGWLDLIWGYDELTLEEQEHTLWACASLGARADNWSVYPVDNGYIQICLTPTICYSGFQFDVAFNRDKIRSADGSAIYPPTINGIVLSASMAEYIHNFKEEIFHYTNNL